ncbi:MAG: C39 family peptidase [Anaerolineae bacterium]|jgi:uncharacterized protein YvpB
MNRRNRRRQPPLFVAWLFLGGLGIAVVGVAVMGQATWRRSREVQALQSRVEALQGTAAAMESRLANLEANDPAQRLAALQAAVETTNDSEELATLRASLTEVQADVDALQATLADLTTRIRALEPAHSSQSGGSLPREAYLTVARQRQSHNLSCESSAASMVAQYHGLALSEAEVLNALPRNDNPNLGFRGNVDGPTGGIEDYGVYAGPVMDVLNARGLRASRVEGGLEGIKAAIARGNPVIAWVTYNCLPSTPATVNIAGEEVTLVPNQHVVVVTGYNAEGVWANDPWDGQQDFYVTVDFQRAMSYFDNMAIEAAAP